MKKILVVGSLNMDLVTEVPHLLAKGETALARNLRQVPGGKGANQAYAVGKLGGRAAMLGAVGDDANGRRLLENLREAGVDVSAVCQRQEEPTGTAVIMVLPSGDNAILVLQGANASVTPDVIRQSMPLIQECDILALQLEIPLETVTFAAVEAAKLGKQVILDPAPAVKELPGELLRSLYLIKPNETELSVLTGRPHCPGRLREDGEYLQRQGVKNVLVSWEPPARTCCGRMGRSAGSPRTPG